jgi:hypothetical protein
MSTKAIPYLLHLATVIMMAGVLAISLSNRTDIKYLNQVKNVITQTDPRPPEEQQLTEETQLQRLKQDIDVLYTQVETLLKASPTGENIRQPSGYSDVNNAIISSTEIETTAANLTQNTQSQPAQPQGQKLFAQLTDKGYVTSENWSQSSKTLESMSPQDNKRFWESMNAALASDELQVLIDVE